MRIEDYLTREEMELVVDWISTGEFLTYTRLQERQRKCESLLRIWGKLPSHVQCVNDTVYRGVRMPAMTARDVLRDGSMVWLPVGCASWSTSEWDARVFYGDGEVNALLSLPPEEATRRCMMNFPALAEFEWPDMGPGMSAKDVDHDLRLQEEVVLEDDGVLRLSEMVELKIGKYTYRPDDEQALIALEDDEYMEYLGIQIDY